MRLPHQARAAFTIPPHSKGWEQVVTQESKEECLESCKGREMDSVSYDLCVRMKDCLNH